MSRTDRIKAEARALWIETFGEAPAEGLGGSEMLQILLDRTEPGRYRHLKAAARSPNLVFPRTV